MSRYYEISNLIGTDLSKYGSINRKYRQLYDYKLTPRGYIRILSKEPPEHPLAKRFDKLVKYTARLIGNPNVNEIKKLYIKLLKKTLIDNDIYEDDIHDLIHLILGQNIRIFLKRKLYTPEEYIYESIVLAIERDLYESVYNFYVAIDAIINKRFVSLSKVFSEDLKVIKLFFKKHKTYNKSHFDFLKKLLIDNRLTNFIHLYKFFILYEMDPSYPLAVNFKNEILKKLIVIVTEDYIESYKHRLYKAIPSILEFFDTDTDSSIFSLKFDNFLSTHFKEYIVTIENLENLFADMDILPEETKNVLKKFIIYSHAVLENYPITKRK